MDDVIIDVICVESRTRVVRSVGMRPSVVTALLLAAAAAPGCASKSTDAEVTTADIRKAANSWRETKG